MKAHQNHLNPSLTINTLDTYIVRSSILRALKQYLPLLEGKLLDVGCGHMPYKQMFLGPSCNVKEYIGLDLTQNKYQAPDISWDGERIPLSNGSVDCAIATEVFEHCEDIEMVMAEIFRVLKPSGVLFLSVPFLWNLHDIPNDEYRYTPFSLRRHLDNSGYVNIDISSLGGWDASLAQMLGLWVRRRLTNTYIQRGVRLVLSVIALPFVWSLYKFDHPPDIFASNTMVTGLCAVAFKPSLHGKD